VKSVLLIGLGNVAVGYDVADPTSAKVLSHARAFASHPAFSLAGGVDPDASCRERFNSAYRLPSYSDIATAMRDLKPDIVVVATPTHLHLDTVKAVFATGRPRALLCEKPLAYQVEQAREIVAACSSNDCELYLNFFRRAEPGVAEIRARLADGRIGKPVEGVVWYSKGLFNSGMHFLDLLQHLLGEVKLARVLAPGQLWLGNDLEPDVEVTFAAGRVIFLAARAKNFFHNTIELIAPNGRLSYEQGGAQIVWQGIEDDPRFHGYIRLDEHGETLPADFDRIQWHITEHLAATLNGRRSHLCTGAEALRIQEILNIIREKK
jgi:predicted dehydrogenase